MERNRSQSQRGVTMVELLAVVIILGILSSIAVPGMMHLINETKDRAFVSIAYELKEAASLHLRAQQLAIETGETQLLTYQILVEDGYIDKIKDPYTNEVLNPGVNSTFVEIMKNAQSKVSYRICLKGVARQICDTSSGAEVGVLFENISTDMITAVD